MTGDVDMQTIAKYAGVFVAALLLINAFEYLVGAVVEGEVADNVLAVVALVLMAVLLGVVVIRLSR